MRKNLETFGIIVTLDYFQHPVTELLYPIDQLSGIAAICPDQLQTGKFPFSFSQNHHSAISVLDVRSMNKDYQKQSHRIHNNMAFPPIHFFACVIAAHSGSFCGFD
jgi:hypothetical protein